MNPETIRVVRASFAKIALISDLAATLFYERLFAIAPEVRPLFADDLGRQKRALISTLQFAVEHLDRKEELLPAVEQLGIRHVRYGVMPEHYPIVGSALLWTLEQGLGSAFTPQVRNAWTSVYEVLATTMQTAAERAPAALAT
ncbi:MAG TPA: globin family protein [Chloroflexota bacterium]